MIDIRNYNLLNNNTFGISETCRRFVQVDTVAELQSFLSSLIPSDLPLLVIGGGSNLLLTKPFEGTVLRSAIMGIDEQDDGDSVLLRCGSGVVWDDVVDYAVTRGYCGMENLSIIPGDVGASAVQNIGAYGKEAKDVIATVEAVEIATGKSFVFSNEDCHYGYRQSRFKSEWKDRFFITHVTYRLSRTFTPSIEYGNISAELDSRGIDNPTMADIRQVIIDIRNAKLPDVKVEGNAGSFFMNPVVDREKYMTLAAENPSMPHYYIDEQHEKIPAGWLIDQCGWKGRSLGKAGVHAKQALVLVNRGGATGNDIVNLCKEVQADVKRRFGIDIYPEVNII